MNKLLNIKKYYVIWRNKEIKTKNIHNLCVGTFESGKETEVFDKNLNDSFDCNPVLINFTIFFSLY